MKLIRKNIARNSKPYDLGHGVAHLSVAANIRAERIKSISISPENDTSQ